LLSAHPVPLLDCTGSRKEKSRQEHQAAINSRDFATERFVPRVELYLAQGTVRLSARLPEPKMNQLAPDARWKCITSKKLRCKRDDWRVIFCTFHGPESLDDWELHNENEILVWSLLPDCSACWFSACTVPVEQ
jgi:hypothetical protein